jgi:hypothetical protein
LSFGDDEKSKKNNLELKRRDKLWIAVAIGVFIALFLFIVLVGLDFIGI